MEQILIRRARATDIDDLVKLLRQLFSIETDFTFNVARQRRGLKMLHEQDCAAIFIAEKANRIIGMCTGQVLVSTTEGDFSLLVEDVIVDKSRRGQGVGTQLLKSLEEWAREKKVSRFQLLADRSNEAALEFYKKQDWHLTQLVCLRKRPIQNNENEGFELC